MKFTLNCSSQQDWKHTWNYWIKLGFCSLNNCLTSALTSLLLSADDKNDHHRAHKGFTNSSIFCLSSYPQNSLIFSYSHSLLYLCSASPASKVITVLILNSYMKTCLMYYTSFLKIKTSVQHTQYPKALITSSLHIGQVRWSKSQGSMHVLWKMCLKKNKHPLELTMKTTRYFFKRCRSNS